MLAISAVLITGCNNENITKVKEEAEVIKEKMPKEVAHVKI